jgi:dCTP deaminase
MGLKPDHWIKKMALEQRMIEPFVDSQVRGGAISYGSRRMATTSASPTNLRYSRMSFRRWSIQALRPEVDGRLPGDVCVIPPNSFALARTVEYFRIPRQVLNDLPGKIDVRQVRHHRECNAIRAGVGSFVTLEISNTTPLPARIYSNEGIAQVLFFEADEPCDISYADKKGKYQSQQSIVLPKV